MVLVEFCPRYRELSTMCGGKALRDGLPVVTPATQAGIGARAHPLERRGHKTNTHGMGTDLDDEGLILN
jgi:hypothetical protein